MTPSPSSNSPQVTIFTDGACQGNPGPGGWAAILQYKTKEKIIQGGSKHTTNNRMELMAAIKALANLKKHCTVQLYTDSQYVRRGITEWIHGWKKTGKLANNKVKNADLWMKLDQLTVNHQIKWHWVPAHSGHQQNERVDNLAKQAIPK